FFPSIHTRFLLWTQPEKDLSMWKRILGRSWFDAGRLYDRFFAYGQGGIGPVRQVLREILTFLPAVRVGKKKKASFVPQLEGLERREVLTTVQFSGSAYSVAESAASITVTATLDFISASNVSAQYTTNDVTAHAGVDFTTTSGTMTIIAGNPSGTF